MEFCQNFEIWFKLWNLIKIVKIWSTLWNLVQIVKIVPNCEIWSKLWKLVQIVKLINNETWLVWYGLVWFDVVGRGHVMNVGRCYVVQVIWRILRLFCKQSRWGGLYVKMRGVMCEDEEGYVWRWGGLCWQGVGIELLGQLEIQNQWEKI